MIIYDLFRCLWCFGWKSEDTVLDGFVKSRISDDFVKSSQARRANPEERSVLLVRCNDEGCGATQHAGFLRGRHT